MEMSFWVTLWALQKFGRRRGFWRKVTAVMT